MKEELMEWAKDVKHTLETSKNVVDMTSAMPILMGSMEYMIANSPQKATEYMEYWNARHCNNYITEREAAEGINKLVNITGESVPRWKPVILFDALKSLNVPEMQENIFNKWAMFYTMNWLYSDYAEELAEAVAQDPTKLATLIYKMSVKKLNDPDNPRWIRKHLGLQ